MVVRTQGIQPQEWVVIFHQGAAAVSRLSSRRSARQSSFIKAQRPSVVLHQGAAATVLAITVAVCWFHRFYGLQFSNVAVCWFHGVYGLRFRHRCGMLLAEGRRRSMLWIRQKMTCKSGVSLSLTLSLSACLPVSLSLSLQTVCE